MGRTLDIPVTCGNPNLPAPSDIMIPISRIGGGSSSSSSGHRNVVVSSPNVTEVPVTPGPRGDMIRNIAVGEPIPRLDLMTGRPCKSTSIFEVPPTPPGGNPGAKCKIREISVSSAKPLHRPVEVEHGTTAQAQQEPVHVDEPGEKAKAGVREINVSSTEGGENDSSAVIDEAVPAGEAMKSSDAPPKALDNSLMDFSLFLVRNARAREQIRGSLKPGKKQPAEPEEDLEALLRKWELAQLEEEASARAKEDEMFRLSSVHPLFPCLKELPLLNYINSEGRIEPQCEPETAVSVFAVYDRLKKMQYVGVSKNVKNTLRKIFGRKPGFCYFYKICNLPQVESLPQPHSLKQRWIEELGAPPPGNADAAQQKLWEQPVDVSADLEKGTTPLAAAINKAKSLIQIMVDRGLKEEMVYDPALMELGRCDVLEASTQAETPKGKHTVINTPHGGSIEYYICYNDKSMTPHGWRYDVTVNKDNEESRHVVTSGTVYPGTITEDGFLEVVLGFLLHKGISRNNVWRHGFSMSNFSMSDFMRKFDDFKPWFSQWC